MQLEQIQQTLEKQLSETIDRTCHQEVFTDVYRYAVLPAGKLFRPKLAWAIALDIQKEPTQEEILDLNAFSCALEIHHAYTLIHDDLPCMDDDDYRRGKLSTHKKFGQWQALLAGDGLLNVSYQLIFKIKHPQMPYLGRYMSWALGPKGLIRGQALDLSKQSNNSFKDLLETHLLKTARLIQVSLVGGQLLASKTPDLKSLKNTHRLGESLGVAFQLLDDLTELGEKLGEHESDINPWCRGDLTQVSQRILKDLVKIEESMGHYPHLNEVLSEYFTKIVGLVEQENIAQTVAQYQKMDPEQVKKELIPVMAFLQRLGHGQ